MSRIALWRPVVAGLVCQAAVAMVRPGVSYRALELGGDEFAVGVLSAAYAVLPLVGALAVGRMAGRVSRIAAVPLVGALLLILGCVVATLAGDLLMLGVGSAVVGIGNLVVLLGAQAWVSRGAASDRYDAVFGWLTAGMSVGQALGPLATGLLVDLTGGAVAVFAAGALTSAGLVLAVASRVRTPPTESEEVGPTGLGILRLGRVRAAMAVGVSLLTAADLLAAYLPLVGERAGIPAVAVGVLLAVRGAASAVSRVVLGVLVRRFTRDGLVLASTIGGALMLGVVAVVDSVPALAVALAVGGFLLGLGQPITMTQVALAVPARARSEALALRLVGNRVAQTVVPVAAGAASLVLGLAAMFGLQAVLLLGAAVWAGLAARGPGGGPSPD